MAIKPHIKLDIINQQDPSVILHYNYGFGDNEKETNDSPDYAFMIENFRKNLSEWRYEKQQRISERNPDLNLQHIDFIKIIFQGQFALNDYFQIWYNDYGLEVVQVDDFGTSILFAVSDNNFSTFISGIQGFIDKESGQNTDALYPNNIKFVKSFQLLTTDRILNRIAAEELLNFRLADLNIEIGRREAVLNSLTEYLNQNNLIYNLDEDSSNLEIRGLTEAQLEELVKNFDVILQVTSALTTIVRPIEFNQNQKDYGFTINVTNQNVPIIGIIDSGVSSNTPLEPLIIVDEELNLTNTPVNEDNTDRGRGHGTAVAALAAMGKKPYINGYSQNLSYDAKILPIKITDETTSYISQYHVVQKLKLAKEKYPNLKIFTLSICYKKHKLYNEHNSSYAYALDKFAYENDCLIFICTGNNSEAALKNDTYNTLYFDNEETNLCTPAESMNNLTVGAASHSLKDGYHIGISISKEYPTLYSRKSHIAFELLKSKAKSNSSIFKPDLLECGGDYGFSDSGMITDIGDSCLELLSANSTESFYQGMGTSFAAPLAANVAVNIQRNYPSITAASIKALMVNSSCLKSIKLSPATLLNRTSGHGLLNELKAVFSDSNRITILIEDKIDADTVKIIPLNFPEYLIKNDLGKKNGILNITATLCFQFKPVFQQQNGYCPLHIAFGFFKNQTGDQIQLTEEKIRSKIKSSGKMWSQNGRYKSKPVPFSNVQKISFPVNVSELENETSTFKLAVQCAVHPQLLPGQKDNYVSDNPFSIVISVEETLKEENLTGNLYDEMVAVNKVIAIADLDLDNIAEANT